MRRFPFDRSSRRGMISGSTLKDSDEKSLGLFQTGSTINDRAFLSFARVSDLDADDMQQSSQFS